MTAFTVTKDLLVGLRVFPHSGDKCSCDEWGPCFYHRVDIYKLHPELVIIPENVMRELCEHKYNVWRKIMTGSIKTYHTTTGTPADHVHNGHCGIAAEVPEKTPAPSKKVADAALTGGSNAAERTTNSIATNEIIKFAQDMYGETLESLVFQMLVHTAQVYIEVSGCDMDCTLLALRENLECES